jgi:hypothetical protein
MKQFGPVVLLALTAFGGTAAGQAMVGYGLGAARATTTIAPARGIGKALDKPWKKLETVASTKSAPLATYEDPGKIEAGLAYTDLIRRFGRPSLEITGEDGVRTLTYLGKNSNAELVVRDGKVASADCRATAVK